MAAVIAGACTIGCGADLHDQGERAVRAYCDALVVAYRTSDASVVRPVTTDKEWRKLHTLIGLKIADGLVLESELESLVVTAAELPSPGVMVVVATERWRYFDRPIRLGAPPSTEYVVEMELEYSFVDEKGVWKMDQAATRRHEYLESEGPRSSAPVSRETGSGSAHP